MFFTEPAYFQMIDPHSFNFSVCISLVSYFCFFIIFFIYFNFLIALNSNDLIFIKTLIVNTLDTLSSLITSRVAFLSKFSYITLVSISA